MRIQRNTVIGVLLLVLGVLFAVRGHGLSLSTGSIFYYFWPSLFVIPVGVFFHWLYFFLNSRGVGLLVPGGIVLTTGIVCQISMLFDSWAIMWPGFILSVAVGLFELYLFGKRNRWLLIPINILTALSALFFIVFTIGSLIGQLSHMQPLLALAIICAGLGFLFIRGKEQRYASRLPWE